MLVSSLQCRTPTRGLAYILDRPVPDPIPPVISDLERIQREAKGVWHLFSDEIRTTDRIVLEFDFKVAIPQHIPTAILHPAQAKVLAFTLLGDAAGNITRQCSHNPTS